MKPDVKRILTKLSENSNVKGLHKINLSKINNVQEFIDIAFSSIETFNEMFDEGIRQVRDSRDVLKFDAKDNAGSAEEELDELLLDIKELGVDIPAKVKQLQKELQNLDSAVKQGEMKLRDAGM